jgi:hypothetical protein
MALQSSKGLAIGVTVAVMMVGLSSAAQSRDFLSALFGGFSESPGVADLHPESVTRLPFASEGLFGSPPAATPRPSYSSGQAYCVRTCDGRYFPITATDRQSRATSCHNFCPASETKVVYGSGIDHAVTDNGKPYSELPNSFRYRNEIVAGCTCNGKDQIGLAPVMIENDPTLRKGDIVASAGGLMVTERGYDKHGAALNMSPASPSIRAKYQRLPVMASD